MRKTAVLMIILLISVSLFAQSPKEIVEKCVSALGGEEAVWKFDDYHAKGEMKVSIYGMEVPGSVESISKGRMTWRRSEAEFMGMRMTIIQAYDGKNAWMDRRGTIVDQPSLNFESDLDHRINLLVKKDASFSLAKETEIEGRRAIGVEVDTKGKKTTFYIDADDFTVLEMVYQDLYYGESQTKEMLDKRVRFSDYREIEGVNFPMSMVVYQKGKKFIEMHFSEISFNPDVASAKFKRPDVKLDLRYRDERMN
jgi:hypothetical protein